MSTQLCVSDLTKWTAMLALHFLPNNDFDLPAVRHPGRALCSQTQDLRAVKYLVCYLP